MNFKTMLERNRTSTKARGKYGRDEAADEGDGRTWLDVAYVIFVAFLIAAGLAVLLIGLCGCADPCRTPRQEHPAPAQKTSPAPDAGSRAETAGRSLAFARGFFDDADGLVADDLRRVAEVLADEAEASLTRRAVRRAELAAQADLIGGEVVGPDDRSLGGLLRDPGQTERPQILGQTGGDGFHEALRGEVLAHVWLIGDVPGLVSRSGSAGRLDAGGQRSLFGGVANGLAAVREVHAQAPQAVEAGVLLRQVRPLRRGAEGAADGDVLRDDFQIEGVVETRKLHGLLRVLDGQDSSAVGRRRLGRFKADPTPDYCLYYRLLSPPSQIQNGAIFITAKQAENGAVTQFSDTWRVTAYCPCKLCCGPRARGVTASGRPAVGKLLAAPPEVPFGTVIDVPGYGPAVVADRGGAIKGRRLDVLMSTHAAARAWGVKYVECRVESAE